MPNIQALKISVNGLNDIRRKKKRKLNVSGCLFIVPYEFIFFIIWYSRATRLACTRASLQCGYSNLQIHSNISKGTRRNQKNLPNFPPKKTPGMENSKPQNIRQQERVSVDCTCRSNSEVPPLPPPPPPPTIGSFPSVV